MNDQSIKTGKQIISISILIIVMLLTFSVFMKGYSCKELVGALKNADYTYLAAGLGMMLIFIACEAYNIKLILYTLGKTVSLKDCLLYSFIGFYFSSITPSASGGQPAQVYYMKRDKISVTLSSITIFYIMLVYQIAMIILGIAAFLFSYSTAVWFISKLKYLFLIGFIVNFSAILIFFLLMFSTKIMPGILSFLIHIGSKLHIVKKTEELKKKAHESMLSYHEKALIIKQNPFLFFRVLSITVVQLLALSLIPYLVYRSMGYPSDHLINLTACQALLTIAVSAIPLPGAEGVTQAGFMQVFGMFFPDGAITYSMLINRVLSFYIPLVISFIIYLFAHIRILKNSLSKQ